MTLSSRIVRGAITGLLVAAPLLADAAEVRTAGTSVPGSMTYPHAGLVEGARTTGCSNIGCGVYDPVGGYAYYGSYAANMAESGHVYKVAVGAGSAPPAVVGVLTLPKEYNQLRSVAIDPNNGYAYFGTSTAPGKVVKVNLGTGADAPTLASVLTLNAGEDYPLSAVLDPVHGYVYFGTYSSPGILVKVATETGDTTPTRVASLTLNTGENHIWSAVIDPADGYALVGTAPDAAPATVVKLALPADATTPTRVGSVQLEPGEEELHCALLDTSSDLALFGTFTEPGIVVKVAAGSAGNPPTRIGALTLDPGEQNLATVIPDSVPGRCCFATDTAPALIVRVDIGTTPAAPTRLGSLPLQPGENRPYGAVLDTATGNACFGTLQPSAVLTKVAFSQKGFIKASRSVLQEAAVTPDVHFYSHSATGNLRLAIYDDSASHNLVWESPVLANTAADSFLSVPCSSGTPPNLTLAPGTYWLAWQSDTATPVASYSQGSYADGFYIPCDFGSFPSTIPATTVTATDEKWTQYVSYEAIADVAIVKSGWPGLVNPDGSLTYKIDVTNNGPNHATSVLVTDTLPAGIGLVACTVSPGSFSVAGDTITWSIGDLSLLETAKLTAFTTVTASGVITNTAGVSTTVTDPTPANDLGQAENTVTTGTMSWWADDAFASDVTNPTPGGTTGWTPFSSYQEGQQTSYDAANTALKITIGSGWYGQPRINGWATGNSEWLPYLAVGTTNYVRARFHVFSAGQADPSNLNEIPNMRLRVSTRFAVNSMVEVFNHLGGDTAGTSAGKELRPSSDPTSPSIYRIDFDPVDVPALSQPGEGVGRGFEAYCLERQENGAIELAESSIGIYPASALPDTGPAVRANKIFQVSGGDAGDLKVFNTLTDGPFLRKFTLLSPGVIGSEVPLDGVGDPYYFEGSNGVTFDSTAVATNRLALIVREFTEVGALTDRIRVEPGRQYKLRWHVKSDTNANRNPQMRLRARSLKFCWSQKLEIGGSFSAGSLNNAIAQQSLPGIGTRNPDRRTPGEPGGWYTMLMHSPIDPAIRAEQPYILAQPGQGADSSSIRDLKYGFDLLDTMSASSSSGMENGNFTLDTLEVRAYDLVAD